MSGYYLVIPERWANDEDIAAVIKDREAECTVIGHFDFLDAERKARAKVDVLRLDFTFGYHRGYQRESMRVDPFKLWFNDNFKIQANKSKISDWKEKEAKRQNVSEVASSELVKDEGLVKVLEKFYHRELENLMSNYLKLGELDAELLTELDINIASLQEALRLKITSLKDMYWRELFNNLTTVTEKLTAKSREALLNTLLANTHVDFSAENAHAVVIWVIKNANAYFDSQLIQLVDNLTEKANVNLYASNKKTFGNEEWRYTRTPDDLTHYQLDYRIVLAQVGGLYTPDYYSSSRNECGLSQRAVSFLNDVCTVATNIGFDTNNQTQAEGFTWDTHVKNSFLFLNHTTNETEVLIEAKAFKNGNLHIKFNQRFMCRLNVEFGRLKGWVKSPRQAADELSLNIDEVNDCFNTDLQLTNSSLLLLAA